MKKRTQLLVFLAMLVSGLDESIAIAQTDSAAENAHDQAVIGAVQSYVDAFNRRDAADISQHWSESGTYLDDDGNTVTGRENIQKAFEAVFADLTEDQILTVNITQVSFVTDDVAVEEGTASLTGGKAGNYTAIHKLENGQWNLHSIKEYETAARHSNHGHLQGLAWMIGDWVDQSDIATVESSCRWSKNGNFITKNFRVTIPGMDTLEGTQVIGYDASANTIRSWLFDSDGGHATGLWKQNGNNWEASSSQVMADGRVGSSTNIFTPLDENQFTWKSIGRKVDGEFLPNVNTVRVARAADDE